MIEWKVTFKTDFFRKQIICYYSSPTRDVILLTKLKIIFLLLPSGARELRLSVIIYHHSPQNRKLYQTVVTGYFRKKSPLTVNFHFTKFTNNRSSHDHIISEDTDFSPAVCGFITIILKWGRESQKFNLALVGKVKGLLSLVICLGSNKALWEIWVSFFRGKWAILRRERYLMEKSLEERDDFDWHLTGQL